MIRIRAALLGLAVAAALFAVAGASADGTDIRSLPFKFSAKVLPPDVGNFSEPSIAVSSKYHVFMCGPQGIGTGNSFVRTADWKNYEGFLITDTPVDGEDCDVKVGPDDAVYEANLQIFGGAIRKSVLDGQGPPAPPNTTGNGSFDYQVYEDTVEQDRQWLAPDPTDGSIVYYGYHDFALESEVVAKSLDGGKTFLLHSVTSTDPNLAPDTYPNTFSGPVRVDPADHNAVVQVYGISTAQDNIDACNATTACFGFPKKVVAAVSTDGGLTWTDHVAMDVSAEGSQILGNLFPWVTWDKAGNLYAMAALGGQDADGKPTNGMYYSWSADKGATWSPMIKINAGDGAIVFPTGAGGTDGVVDFAWLESTAQDQGDNGTWSVHFAQVRHADSESPRTRERTGPAVRTGAVCTLGILCDGNRELGDFMELALDPFGYAHIAAPGTDDQGHVYDLWWRQNQGPSATSAPCKPVCVTERPGPQ
jgi:hypothetical protein